jgi:hypothetical protein
MDTIDFIFFINANCFVTKIVFSVYASELRGAVHFDRLTFFQIFSLDKKLFATSKFWDKNYFEQKLLLLSSLCIIWFFSDRLCLLYKSSFEKHSKNARLKFIQFVYIQFLRQNLKFKILKKLNFDTSKKILFFMSWIKLIYNGGWIGLPIWQLSVWKNLVNSG